MYAHASTNWALDTTRAPASTLLPPRRADAAAFYLAAHHAAGHPGLAPTAPTVLSSIRPPPMPQHIVQRLQRRQRRRDAATRLQAVARGMAARRTAHVARATQPAADARSARVTTSEVGAVDVSPSGTSSTCPTCILGDESTGGSSSAASSTAAAPSTSALGWSVCDRLTAHGSTQQGPQDAITPAEDPDTPSSATDMYYV